MHALTVYVIKNILGTYNFTFSALFSDIDVNFTTYLNFYMQHNNTVHTKDIPYPVFKVQAVGQSNLCTATCVRETMHQAGTQHTRRIKQKVGYTLTVMPFILLV